MNPSRIAGGRLRDGAVLAATLTILGVLLAQLGPAAFYWTDVPEIEQRQLITDSVAELFRAMTVGIEGYYFRPTLFALHSLNHWLTGDAAFGFRLFNALLHAGNAALVYALIRSLGANKEWAGATGALFAIHPLAVTPIGWVSDRTDLVTLGSALGCAWLTASHVSRPRPWKVMVQAGVLFVGLGAKETCAAVVIVTAAVWLASTAPTRKALLPVLVAQGAVVAFWLGWLAHVTSNPSVVENRLGLVDRLALAASIHGDYALQLAFPWTLTVCDATRLPQGPGALPVLAACGIGLSVLWWRSPPVKQSLFWLGLLWAAAFLAPTSGLVPLKHVRADRYLYCALPGLMLAVVAMVMMRASLARYRAALFTAAFCYLGTSLFVRAQHFTSERALWSFEVARNPDCMEGWLNLARTAYIAKDIAATEAAVARLVETRDLVAYRNEVAEGYYRALVYKATGDTEQAASLLERLMREDRRGNSSVAESAYELSLIRLSQRRYSDAVVALTRYVDGRLSIRNRKDALLLRSYAQLAQGQVAAARADFAAYEAIAPDGAESPSRRRLASQLRGELE